MNRRKMRLATNNWDYRHSMLSFRVWVAQNIRRPQRSLLNEMIGKIGWLFVGYAFLGRDPPPPLVEYVMPPSPEARGCSILATLPSCPLFTEDGTYWSRYTIIRGRQSSS